MPVCVVAGLAGCAAPASEYPSLTCRPASPMSVVDPAYAQSLRPQPSVDRSVLLTPEQISENTARLSELDRRFEASLRTNRATIASGSRAAPESPAFAAAQLALTDLTSIHADVVAILAALEQSYAQSSLVFEASDEIVEASALAETMATRQREQLETVTTP